MQMPMYSVAVGTAFGRVSSMGHPSRLDGQSAPKTSLGIRIFQESKEYQRMDGAFQLARSMEMAWALSHHVQALIFVPVLRVMWPLAETLFSPSLFYPLPYNGDGKWGCSEE